jgi:hypothetical protein
METYQIAIIAALVLFLIYYNYSRNSTKLLNQSLELWFNQIYQTREYMLSYFQISSNVQPCLDRLIQNQQDIGNFLGNYLGTTTGATIAELFTEHINILPKVLASANTSQQTPDWSENMEKIALSLSTALKADFKGLNIILQKYLDLTEAQAISIKAKDYYQSQQDFNNIMLNIKDISHIITNNMISLNTSAMIYTLW